LGAGGAERQVVNLATGLGRRAHDVRILTFYDGAGVDAARADGAVVVPLGKTGRWDIARFYARVLHELGSRRPDVLYAMLPGANVAAALAWRRRRGAILALGVRASRMMLARYDHVTRATYALEAMLAKRADVIIANAEAGRADAIMRGFPAGRLRVVANGIDTARFHPDPSARRAWRARFGLAADTPVIGMVARVDPMKAHDVFLDAAATLHVAKPQVRFILAGSGADAANTALASAIARRGLTHAMILTGERTDIETLYPAFDVAALSSAFGEGFSNAIAEAMASGIPCVATDIGDCRTIIADTGRVVAPGDAAGLAAAWEATLALTASERIALGTAARARIVENYGVDHLAEETERVLLGAL
jgi:glycosyltransferase involved in cell wall biosynthesis